jgi:DNA processing protein
VNHPAELQLGEVEQRVLDAVGGTGATVDEIVDGTELSASQALSAISVLEMRRLVRRLPGSRVERL